MNDADRRQLHQLATLLIGHALQLDYPTHDVRGRLDAETFALTKAQMESRLARGGRLMFDCSGSITCLYKWAGLHDPNGLDYAHEGYTGTMLAHLPHYSDAAKARTGAIVIFGPGTGLHAAMVLEPADDPLLISHGGEHLIGPIRLSKERTYHRAPVTFLNVSGL